jgi:hypothetical protein
VAGTAHASLCRRRAQRRRFGHRAGRPAHPGGGAGRSADGIGEYTRWHLGIDDEEDEDNKGRYKFPYGDFEKVHRCGLLAAESRAGQRKYYDIELAVAHLHGMLEALRRTA